METVVGAAKVFVPDGDPGCINLFATLIRNGPNVPSEAKCEDWLQVIGKSRSIF